MNRFVIATNVILAYLSTESRKCHGPPGIPGDCGSPVGHDKSDSCRLVPDERPQRMARKCDDTERLADRRAKTSHWIRSRRSRWKFQSVGSGRGLPYDYDALSSLNYVIH